MKKMIAAMIVIAASGTAMAGGQKGTVGVGAEYQLSGLGGASLNYDAGQFTTGGFFGFIDPPQANNTVFELGGRFFYHVHSTAMADFGLGGDLGLASVPVMTGMMTNRNTYVFLEPAFQIRLFLASNVALSFNGGLTIGVVDASGVAITGQGIGGSFNIVGAAAGFTGGAGVHYYFF